VRDNVSIRIVIIIKSTLLKMEARKKVKTNTETPV